MNTYTTEDMPQGYTLVRRGLLSWTYTYPPDTPEPLRQPAINWFRAKWAREAAYQHQEWVKNLRWEIHCDELTLRSQIIRMIERWESVCGTDKPPLDRGECLDELKDLLEKRTAT